MPLYAMRDRRSGRGGSATAWLMTSSVRLPAIARPHAVGLALCAIGSGAQAFPGSRPVVGGHDRVGSRRGSLEIVDKRYIKTSYRASRNRPQASYAGPREERRLWTVSRVRSP